MPTYHAFFMFKSGLKYPMKVPINMCKLIREHIEDITEKCGLTVEQNGINPSHWTCYEPAETVDNETASNLVRQHNEWVEWIYERFATWSKNPPENYEELTPAFAQSVWYGFSKLRLPVTRWSREYYQQEMQRLFDVMRGENDNEITWETDPLTPRQAADVIQLFETYLDHHDMRLELPYGEDTQLLNSDDYDWCPVHGAIPIDDTEEDDDGNVLCPVCHEILS